jgi:hypothetical protein
VAQFGITAAFFVQNGENFCLYEKLKRKGKAVGKVVKNSMVLWSTEKLGLKTRLKKVSRQNSD